MNEITDTATLRAHFGAPSERAVLKPLDHLDRHCRAFIALSPFAVLATADGEGNADASPRGDAPGFVHVLDSHTLLLPDRPGNRRIDSLQNIIAHPGVGLIFFVPGINETVRVNGSATVTTDPALLAPLEAQGKIPNSALLITVREAYYHCAKALIRSRLWHDTYKIERTALPSYGQMMKDQIEIEDTVQQVEDSIADAYKTRLY